MDETKIIEKVESIKKLENTHFIILVILVLLWIGSTHYAVTHQTDKVVGKMLAIEYDKVGWMENYVKINKIQKEQIIAWLKQYEAQNWKIDTNQAPQANNTVAPSNTWNKISLEQAKKVTNENTYILWNPDAEITWVEYSDLECPFCKKLHLSWTIDDIIKSYDWKVNFVFKQFPLNFHENAPKEAEWALCAWELGWSDKYYSYVNTIYERTRWNGRGFALDALVPLAKELWIDEDKFKTCLDSGKYTSRVQSETSEWQTFGISGTPWNVFINNKTGKWDKLPWAYPEASFKQKIDSLLK